MTIKEAVDKITIEEDEPVAGVRLSISVECIVDIWFDNSENDQKNIKSMINEAQHRGTPLVGTWSVQKHPPHGGQGEFHLELYNKNNKVFALNKSGTAHDKSHKVPIPNAVADALRKKFPNWTIPPDNLIEGASIDWPDVWAINKILND